MARFSRWNPNWSPQYYVGIGLYIYKIVYASLKHLYSIWIVILGVWKFSTPVATHGHTPSWSKKLTGTCMQMMTSYFGQAYSGEEEISQCYEK